MDSATGSDFVLDATLAAHAGEIAALIVEPLVQCAGGMRMHDPEYLRLARQLCDRYGAHLICDEIAVGFGRTGSFFAHEQAGIRPDFLCLSKGISGGYLPLAATLTTERVFNGFQAPEHTFYYGHSYTANPLGCAAALASLEVFREERVLEQLPEKIELFRQEAHEG